MMFTLALTLSLISVPFSGTYPAGETLERTAQDYVWSAEAKQIPDSNAHEPLRRQAMGYEYNFDLDCCTNNSYGTCAGDGC